MRTNVVVELLSLVAFSFRLKWSRTHTRKNRNPKIKVKKGTIKESDRRLTVRETERPWPFSPHIGFSFSFVPVSARLPTRGYPALSTFSSFILCYEKLVPHSSVSTQENGGENGSDNAVHRPRLQSSLEEPNGVQSIPFYHYLLL